MKYAKQPKVEVCHQSANKAADGCAMFYANAPFLQGKLSAECSGGSSAWGRMSYSYFDMYHPVQLNTPS